MHQRSPLKKFDNVIKVIKEKWLYCYINCVRAF